jgi:PRTRC genetic system protein C
MSEEEKEGLKPVKRVFKFGDIELPDPGEHMTPEEVMDLYSRQHPSLTTGQIAGPFHEDGKANYKLKGQETYEMRGNYGTKG